MTTKNRVYLTSSTSLSCAGDSNQALFDNVVNGVTGIAKDPNYFDSATPAIGKFTQNYNFHKALVSQCQYILDLCQLEDFTDTLLIVGSSVGGMAETEKRFFKDKNYTNIDPNFHNIHTIAHVLKSHFDFYDDISFSTACTSSANAIGYAYEVLSKGLYKRVLVVGADSLTHTTIGGFLSLGVLSSAPCKPFDISRDGMNVAEAIACLLIETEPQQNCVEIKGVGYSSDAYHMTHPHPEGLGAISAMSSALRAANLDTEDIDYINAHGTGTSANDNAEANAIASLFGEHTPVSSTKAITGHTLGAAGALEAIISSLVLTEGILPQNTFLDKAENTDIALMKKSKISSVSYVLSNSFAFGGNNCSLIFGAVK